MKLALLTVLFTFSFLQIFAADLLVPSQYPTIQEAIFAANTGDVIIVDNGTYYENINFFGKEITVTSNFHTSGDLLDIKTTVINGSQPTNSEAASCVTFTTGETENSILKGFTISEGSGTKVYNSAEDLYFRTGGGIIIDQASPTIINNIIINNECVAETGVFGAGGGGIRMGFGNPLIKNNIIDGNIGGYAGGIMIAYCGGAILSNNVITNNTATGSFNGGGGVYVDWESVTLENNTIANNHSGDLGGGIISTGTNTVIRNCIVYGNTSVNGFPQIFKRFGGNATMTYSTVEGGFDGNGNEEGVITNNPQFEAGSAYTLDNSSPCIDAGHPDLIYNDMEDPNALGSALLPSKGNLRNDMGAYGGQGAISILSVPSFESATEIININYTNPYHNQGIYITVKSPQSIKMHLFGFSGKKLAESHKISLLEGLNFVPLSISTNSLVLLETSLKKTTAIKLISINKY